MTPRSWSQIAAMCALLACADEEKKVPSAPAGPANSGARDRDAGSKPSEDEDAGPMDAGPPITLCTRITGTSGGMDSAEIGTWVQTPGDLALTRQVERWTNDCSKPHLILEFSDGACPLGNGHSVTFDFDYQAVLDGVIHGGNNILGAESETPGLSVRYVRPKKLDPHGTWGTCEGASGQVIFGIAPVLDPGQYLQARYQLDLSRCAAGGTAETIFLEGAFNVLLRTSRRDACPTSAGAGGSGGLGTAGAGFGAGGFGEFGRGGTGGTTGF